MGKSLYKLMIQSRYEMFPEFCSKFSSSRKETGILGNEWPISLKGQVSTVKAKNQGNYPDNSGHPNLSWPEIGTCKSNLLCRIWSPYNSGGVEVPQHFLRKLASFATSDKGEVRVLM